MKKNIILVFLLAVFTSCNSISTTLPQMRKNISLENSHWILEENEPNASEITLSIESDKVSGNASCNDYFGKVNFDKNTQSFSIKNIGVTRKSCPKMSAENFYLGILDKVNYYKATENTLELYDGEILLLKFKKK